MKRLFLALPLCVALVFFTGTPMAHAHTTCASLASQGKHYADTGRLLSSVRVYTRTLARCPHQHHARFWRARVYVALGQFERAADDFARVVAHRPQWSKAHGGLAWSLYRVGDYEKALPHAEHAVALAPDDYYAWHTLGAVHEARGYLPGAARAYLTAWRADPIRRKGLAELFHLNVFPDWHDRA